MEQVVTNQSGDSLGTSTNESKNSEAGEVIGQQESLQSGIDGEYKRKADGNPVECRIRVYKLNGMNFPNIAMPALSPTREKDFMGFTEEIIDFDLFSSGDILSSTINHLATPDINMTSADITMAKF